MPPLANRLHRSPDHVEEGAGRGGARRSTASNAKKPRTPETNCYDGASRWGRAPDARSSITMDQLETQANDLRYLSQSSAPPPAGHGTVSSSPRHSLSGSLMGDASAPMVLSPGDLRPPTKRKTDDDDVGGKQQRSKRNRYISIACNECKRRKIKCNGENPCQRCGNLNLSCLYAPNCCSNSFRESDEFRQMTDQVTQLQDQVDAIFQSMTTLRQETLRLAPIQERVLPLPSSTVSPSTGSSSGRSMHHKPELPSFRQPAAFRGPTSNTFTVDVAKNTLHNLGYSGVPDGQDDNGIAPEDASNTSPFIRPSLHNSHLLPDPLWEFDKDEMIRLCRVHEEEVGIMYPVVKIESVIDHARTMATSFETGRNNGVPPPTSQDEAITDMKTLTLKIIMCCALVVEEHGQSQKAIRLFESLRPIADRMLMSDPSEFFNIPFLALLAGYRFLSNDEILAWRVMGQVARHCLELGLHRREGLAKIKDDQHRKNAINTFWTAYVLDRRWSFGTGLPYVVQDDKIDPDLPYPDEYPYLVAMITYSRLGAKIWKLVDYFEPALIRDLKREEFDRLDEEILQWYDTVPEEVKISNFGKELPLASTPSYNLQRLQIWTRLRLNQIRIWLHTPVLHSASSIQENIELAQKAVDLAKETIQYLTRLNNSTNLYRRIQVFYHQFLTSAIAVLFLASTHAPLDFSANCRTEFYMALELVKDMSSKSWVSQRLWSTVRSLKAYAPRLGLQEDDPHSSAALAMAGLASGQRMGAAAAASASGASSNSPGSLSSTTYGRPGSLGPPPQPQHAVAVNTSTPARVQQQAPADGQDNGARLSNEMTKIFEGYMGINGLPLSAAYVEDRHGSTAAPVWYRNGVLQGQQQEQASGNGAQDVGVYRQFKDMF